MKTIVEPVFRVPKSLGLVPDWGIADRFFPTTTVGGFDAVVDSEAEIIWLEDPLSYPYVRETVVSEFPPKLDPFLRGLRVIGYSTRFSGNPGPIRLWYLEVGDLNKPEIPWNAVDPASIREARSSLRRH